MSSNKKKEIPEYEGAKGIRATLNSYGYSNDEIGFNEERGTVTLGGKDLMKPEIYDSENGITYANEESIRNSLKNFSDPVVEVTPYYSNYAGNNNLSMYSIGFSDGDVTLGGERIPYTFIDENNKAWAKQSVLDNAFAKYKNSTDIKSNYNIFNKYDRLYGGELDKLLENVTNRDEFEYNAEDDPVYKAYKAMYEREGNRSAEDTMAAYSAQTGGYANSAAVTAAADARQYYSQKLTDKIPELEERAYNRYMAEYENDIKALDALRELYTDMFGMEYTVNRDTASDLYKAQADDIERDRYAEESSREKMLAELEYMLGLQEYDANSIFNEQKQKKNDQDYEIGKQTIKKNDQDYEIGQQKIRKNEQDFEIGEQTIRKNEQDYRKGEQELLMDKIRQQILEQEKVLNSQKMQKNAQSMQTNGQTKSQNSILNEQKIRKNEQEIQMNDLEYSIKKYKLDLLTED